MPEDVIAPEPNEIPIADLLPDSADQLLQPDPHEVPITALLPALVDDSADQSLQPDSREVPVTDLVLPALVDECAELLQPDPDEVPDSTLTTASIERALSGDLPIGSLARRDSSPGERDFGSAPCGGIRMWVGRPHHEINTGTFLTLVCESRSCSEWFNVRNRWIDTTYFVCGECFSKMIQFPDDICAFTPSPKRRRWS